MSTTTNACLDGISSFCLDGSRDETVAIIVVLVLLAVSVPFIFVPWVRSWRDDDQARITVAAGVKITASQRAASYIRKHGSVVYVWVDSETLLRATSAPPTELEFERFAGLSFAIFVEQGLKLGSWLRIDRDLFPPWGLVVVWRDMAGG